MTSAAWTGVRDQIRLQYRPLTYRHEAQPVPEIDDRVHAFVPGPRCAREPLGDGPLSGLTFAVKDLFDVAGEATTFGNPDWARTHPPATGNAPPVTALLEAGARLVGKTKTVELAYGLTGENVWHGTPRNPAAPDRFPGGSSCGSAAATAAGLVDFALGSDTGGSVRIPASYCGLFGIRPSHGAISLAGACPLAPSLDTLGWFARDASMLARVGSVLLPAGETAVGGPLVLVMEAWSNANPNVLNGLRPAIGALEEAYGRSVTVNLIPEGLATAFSHFRALQAEEAWASLGPWVEATKPAFGPGIGDRFEAARTLDPADAKAGRAYRQIMRARVLPLLAGGAILVYPTSPGPAPYLSSSLPEQNELRAATMGVTAIAGFCGLPEVTLPAMTLDGAPVGLSLVAGPGRDRALLAKAIEVVRILGLPH